MKKLISILLVLVMILSVTALAAEPEHICAGKCDHEHEETAIEPRWQCSSHNLVPYAEVEYLQYDENYHYFRSITGDVCINANCDYKWIEYGGWRSDVHHFAAYTNECVECLYMRTN